MKTTPKNPTWQGEAAARDDGGQRTGVAERPGDWIPDDDAGEATRDYCSHDSENSLGGRPPERPKRRGRRRRSLLWPLPRHARRRDMLAAARCSRNTLAAATRHARRRDVARSPREATRSDKNSDNGFDVLTGFSVADFAKSFAEQRKSTSGYALFVFGNLVCWKSKLQPLAAGSAHEAELIALAFAADEGVWLRRMLKDIKFAVNSAKPKYFATIKRGTATLAPRDGTKFVG